MKLSPQYLAGLFDGEGSIVISKRHIVLANGKKAPWYVMVTCLVNTHLPVLIAARSEFETGKKRIYGNHGMATKPGSMAKRKCYMWHAASDIAENFLRHIRPHLIIKADEADLAFKFRDHVRKYKHAHMKFGRDKTAWLSSDLHHKIQDERQEMYLEMQRLKRRTF